MGYAFSMKFIAPASATASKRYPAEVAFMQVVHALPVYETCPMAVQHLWMVGAAYIQ
jgi:hypothetical protein